VWEGEWLDGKRHGVGQLSLRDGSVVSGVWEGNAWAGGGARIVYGNGSGVYEGGVVAETWQRQGRGVWRGSNGEVYEGDWSSDQRSGHGQWNSGANGAMYIPLCPKRSVYNCRCIWHCLSRAALYSHSPLPLFPLSRWDCVWANNMIDCSQVCVCLCVRVCVFCASVCVSLSLSLWCVCLSVCVCVNSMIYCLQLVQVQFIDGSSYKGTVHLTAAAAASADRDSVQNAGFPFNSPVPVATPVFHGCGCLNSFDGFTCVRVCVACTALCSPPRFIVAECTVTDTLSFVFDCAVTDTPASLPTACGRGRACGPQPTAACAMMASGPWD